MKAIRIHAHGGPEVLRLDDVPEPAPGPGEALLRVRAASINHLDLWYRRGLPGVKIPLPHIPGCDAAGEIAALGSGVSGLAVGQKVLLNPQVTCGHCEFCESGEGSLCLAYQIFGEMRPGTDVEFIAVPARCCFPMPAGASFEEAAAFGLVSLTAWRMLTTKGDVKAGDDVLLLAVGGGVGTMAVQIAKLHGARVIATAGSEEKLEKAKALGADIVIHHGKEDVAKRVREITGKRGVDLVIEHLGGGVWEKAILSLRRGGTLVTCGATTGYEAKTDLRHLFFRQLRILGSTMGSDAEFREVHRLYMAGRIKPVLHGAFPLAEAAAAHRLLEARGVFGKLVLVP